MMLLSKPYIICSDSDPQWLEERRKRITASDMAVFSGTAPSFWSDTREELIARKLEGREKEFDDRGRRRIAHGNLKERLVVRAASRVLGYPTSTAGVLIGNERWPYLGATLDGLLHPLTGSLRAVPDLTLTSKPMAAQVIGDALEGVQGPVLLECKVTDTGHRYKERDGRHVGLKAWQDYTPDYHVLQVQAGLWMADLHVGLLCGMLGGDDMIICHVPRDPSLESLFDQMNEDAGKALAPLYEAANDE